MSNMHVICRRAEGSIRMRESKLSKPHRHHIYRINVLYKTLLFTTYVEFVHQRNLNSMINCLHFTTLAQLLQ